MSTLPFKIGDRIINLTKTNERLGFENEKNLVVKDSRGGRYVGILSPHKPPYKTLKINGLYLIEGKGLQFNPGDCIVMQMWYGPSTGGFKCEFNGLEIYDEFGNNISNKFKRNSQEYELKILNNRIRITRGSERRPTDPNRIFAENNHGSHKRRVEVNFRWVFHKPIRVKKIVWNFGVKHRTSYYAQYIIKEKEYTCTNITSGNIRVLECNDVF